MDKVADITLKHIWDAILQTKTDIYAYIDAKIAPIQASIEKIQGSMSIISDQINTLEQRVSSNEDNVEDLTKRVKLLEKENIYLRAKVDDAENRSRACNLRFINIPEKSEGRDTIAFMNKLIPQLLGKESFPTSAPIEKAHRTPTFLPGNKTDRPRPILVKFLSFQDKVHILRLAKEKKELLFQGSRIYIFPDFSADLTKRRREFDAVKNKFREMDIKYSMMYPCILRIHEDG